MFDYNGQDEATGLEQSDDEYKGFYDAEPDERSFLDADEARADREEEEEEERKREEERDKIQEQRDMLKKRHVVDRGDMGRCAGKKQEDIDVSDMECPF